ncbi:MAG TPA: Bax inhibitor-1/YccA family protein [Mycobacterium sp.]|nr:Bax inhibitor-1/YccA family protein [Mycobacterium sp.]
MSQFDASTAFGSDARVEHDFLRQVFAWMFLALAMTTGVAILFHNHATFNYLAQHPTLFYIAIFAQLGFVIGLRYFVLSPRISTQVAAFAFFIYAALTGAVFSILLDVYTTDSVVGAFAGACGVFAAMALLGYTTQMDLSRFGPILFGALIGMVVASFVYIFTGGATLNLIIGFVGVVLFSALTAYDIQNLKRLRSGGAISGRFGGFGGRGGGGRQVSFAASDASAEKLAILGALWLYLDFINLFVSLLRIFGGRR